MEATGTLVEGMGYYLCCSEEAYGFDPCPFCGGEYQEIYEAGVNWMSIPKTCRYIVRCDCGARLDGSAEVYPGERQERAIVDAAQREWNRRA